MAQQHEPFQPRTRQQGTLLAIVAISLLPVIGLITAFYTESMREIQAHETQKIIGRATDRALAGMEVGRNIIMKSTYDNPLYQDRNSEIRSALSDDDPSHLRPNEDATLFMVFNKDTGRREFRTYGDATAPSGNYSAYHLLRTLDMEDDQNNEADDRNDKVDVYVVQLTDLWHMVEAEAHMRNVTRTARMVVRERDPFTRFSVLIDKHYQGIGGSPKGDIHTNKTLQIFFPGGNFDDFVSAHDGFQWMIGASASNTTFNAGFDEHTPKEIELPDLAAVQHRVRPNVANPAAYERGSDFIYVGSDYQNVQVQFNGSTVQVSAEAAANPGAPIPLYNGPLAGLDRIYTVGAISSIQGAVDGRLTVVSESSAGVTITGSIHYVDSHGEPAMLNPNNPSNYIENPDYQGDSAVGIIAPQGSVSYAHDIPNNIEVHAAVYSGGTVGLPGLGYTGPQAPWPYSWPGYGPGQYVYTWDPSFQKQNLMVLGLTISRYRWTSTVVDGAGNVLSGFQDGNIQYDRKLLNNPPPFFLDMDRPLFKAVEIIENNVSAGT